MENVVAIFTLNGDPDELLAAYDRAMPAIKAGTPEYGAPLAHVCARTDDGIRIVDVWESGEALQRFVEHPRFNEALRDARLKQPDAVEVLPAHAVGWPAREGAAV
jgi:hypothetical protein